MNLRSVGWGTDGIEGGTRGKKRGLKRESEARQPDAGEGLPRLAIPSLQRVSGAEFGADWVEPMSTSRAGRLSLTVTYANSFPVPPIKPVSLVTQLFHKLRANHKP